MLNWVLHLPWTSNSSTGPLLNTTIVITRHLPALSSPNFQSLTASSTCYLFTPSPSSPIIPLSKLKDFLKTSLSNSSLILIVFHATWKHAWEIVYLSKFVTRVWLERFDEAAEVWSIYDLELALKKEQCCGCVSTLEAVAIWLRAVEDDGPYVEGKGGFVRFLKEMVRLQFLKPINLRHKLLKRNKVGEKMIRIKLL